MFRKLFYLVSFVFLVSISFPAKADLVITNGDFEVGAGPSTPDVNDWYDNNAGGFWEDAWQSNDSWITPNGSQVVVFCSWDTVEGDPLAGSYLYQGIGTSTGESSVTISFDWGCPDDVAAGRHDALTISILASDGSFVADNANDVLGAAGITLLDYASYDYVALGTDGEIFPVVVTLDLSGANVGDEIFLRFNNYLPEAGADPWPVLDNVQITEVFTAPTIAWVSYHAADDEPHANAAAVGFTQAPDIGYTDLLKANGYRVTRVLTSQSPDVDYLNTFDLVIISRTASSGHYGGSGATLWNSITAPMINLNGYTLRSSRLGFTDGTDMPDTTGDIRLAVTDPTHPIFMGIALTDGVMDNMYAQGAVPLPTDPNIISRGISINNNNLDEEGTVLATISEVSAETGPVGGLVIAELPAGATLQNSSGSSDDVLGGPRLVFLTGSREPSGVTGGEAAALFDLYPDGEKMFLNAVKYMIPVVPVDPGTDGLVAYYELENDANDSSGNGLDGTIVGDPVFVEGATGMGLQLDGVDDYVNLGNDPLFDLTEQVTLSLWVNTQDIGTTQNNPWLGKGDTSYMIKGHRVGNQIEFFVYDGGWRTAHADVGAEFNGDWHHAAGTFDGKQLKIYVDGDLSVTSDYVGGITPNTYNVAIGTNTQAGGRFSESIIDEAMIYNRALSEGEILYLAGFRLPVDPGTDGLVAHYAFENDTTDSSGNGLDGTIIGDATFAEGVAGMALDFNGDDYVDCGGAAEFSFTDAMTVSTWVNIRSVTTAWMAMIAKGENAWRLGVNNTTSGVHYAFSGGGRGWQAANTATELAFDEWYHVAATYDTNVGATVYINGVPDASNPDLGGIDTNAFSLLLGENPEATGRLFDGMLDEIMIYNRALSKEEILFLGQ